MSYYYSSYLRSTRQHREELDSEDPGQFTCSTNQIQFFQNLQIASDPIHVMFHHSPSGNKMYIVIGHNTVYQLLNQSISHSITQTD